MFFTTNGIGDGIPYTQTQHFNWLLASFGNGVAPGYRSFLQPGVNSGNISINAGGAYVFGAFYDSDANTTVTIPTPSIGTTGHRIVLRKDDLAQTVRITLLSSADGVSTIPDANASTDVSICTLTKTTAGAVTLSDARPFIRVPYSRQGGDATDWSAFGSTDYSISNMRVQFGSAKTGSGGATSGLINITFQTPFSDLPIVFIHAQTALSAKAANVGEITVNGFEGIVRNTFDNSFSLDTVVFWIAIGPI